MIILKVKFNHKNNYNCITYVIQIVKFRIRSLSSLKVRGSEFRLKPAGLGSFNKIFFKCT